MLVVEIGDDYMGLLLLSMFENFYNKQLRKRNGTRMPF